MITETIPLANLPSRYAARVLPTIGELAPLSAGTRDREKSVGCLRTCIFPLKRFRAEGVGGAR
jgi:hypothetical protein